MSAGIGREVRVGGFLNHQRCENGPGTGIGNGRYCGVMEFVSATNSSTLKIVDRY